MEFRLVLCMTPADCSQNAKFIKPWLKKIEGETDGQFTAKKCAERFVTGTWQAWAVVKGDVSFGLYASEIAKQDDGRMVGMVRFVTGRDYHAWSHLYAEIEKWAKAGGCYKMVNIGRIGLKRGVLADYDVTHWVYERNL